MIGNTKTGHYVVDNRKDLLQTPQVMMAEVSDWKEYKKTVKQMKVQKPFSTQCPEVLPFQKCHVTPLEES